MNQKIKNILVTLTFLLFLALFVCLCAARAAHPVTYSTVEKRPMATLPTDVTWETILDKSAMRKFEDFTVDQFPLREFFRSIKAKFVIHVLGMKQNNGYAIENGSIAQIKAAFDQKNLDFSIGRLSYLYDRYLREHDGDVYLALIPDKNYFFGKDYGYPTPDYEGLVEQVKAALPHATYIDLFSVLTLEDYYKTDWHWDQARLSAVLETLGNTMGFAQRLPQDYKHHTLAPFFGGYYDQSALYPAPEELTYLTNDVIDACTLYDYATGKTSGLYIRELFDSDTSYDFFMSGLQGLQRIDNPIAATEDELIVFRDSYGSSLLPLMAQAYKTVYVVDIRNVLPTTLGSTLDFAGKDVLFLYSSTVLDTNTFK